MRHIVHTRERERERGARVLYWKRDNHTDRTRARETHVQRVCRQVSQKNSLCSIVGASKHGDDVRHTAMRRLGVLWGAWWLKFRVCSVR